MFKLVVTLCISLVMALSGIGFAQEITHYTYSGHGEKWLEHLENMAEEFRQETGIHVNVIQSSGNYTEQTLVMISGGVAPDVTDFHPMIGATLIKEELFENLQPYVDRSGLDLSLFPPVTVAGVTAPNGTLWGIPISIYPVTTFFNRDMFAAAGLTDPIRLGDDWTWETFRESARHLTVDRNGDGSPDQYGTERRITARWEQQVHQAGGQWFDRLVFPTESRLNSPEVLEAVRFFAGLINDDRVAAPSGYTIWPPAANVAITLVDGPGVVGTRWQESPVDWDIALQPRGSASRAARVNPDGFQILKDSTNKEAAWRWIHFLVGDVERQVRFSATTGRLPSLRDAMLRYDEIPLDLPSNWMAFIDTAFDPDGYAAYVVPSEVTAAMNPTINRIWNGELAPEAGLQQAHDVVNSILAGQ